MVSSIIRQHCATLNIPFEVIPEHGLHQMYFDDDTVVIVDVNSRYTPTALMLDPSPRPHNLMLGQKSGLSSGGAIKFKTWTHRQRASHPVQTQL